MRRRPARKLCIAIILAFTVGLNGCSEDSRTAAQHMEAARQYQAKGKLHSSVIELKNAIKKAPGDAEARAMLGRVYLALADGVSAEKELRRAIENGSEDVQTHLALAEALILTGQNDAALETLTSANAEQGTDVFAEKNALLAKVYLAKQNPEKTVQHLNRVLEIAPDNPEYLLLKSQYLASENDLAAARTSIDEVLAIDPTFDKALLFKARLAQLQNNNDVAIAAYRQLIDQAGSSRLNHVNSAAHIGLALLSLRIGDIETGRSSAEVLYKANKRHPIPNYLQGLVAYQTQDYAKAIEYLQVAYAEAPKHAPTLLTLGAANYALGHYNQAVTYLNNYLSLMPGDGRATKLLSAAYMNLDEAEEAMRVLTTSLEQAPEDQELLSMAGEAAIRAGELESGKRYFEKAAKHAASATGRMRLASIYMAEGDNQRAIEELESTIAEFGEDEKSTVLLIKAYLRDGQTQRALEEAKNYVDSHKNAARAYNLLGAVYVATGEIDMAGKQFKMALSKDEENITARISLARLAIAKKDWNEARQWLQRVINHDESHLLTNMLLARVAEFEGKKDEAIQWLEKAAEFNPNAVAPRLLLANYYMKTANAKQADTYLAEILAVQPKNRPALGLRVDNYLRSGDIEKALGAARTLTEVAATQPGGYVKLAQVQLAANDPVAARRSLEKALTLRSGYYPAAAALARLELEAGAVDEALKVAKQVQQMQPNAAAGYSLEGDIHLASKQYGKAVQSYAAAMERQTMSSLVVRYAEALRFAGEPWSAVQRPLNNWLSTHPEDVAVWVRMGMEANAAGRRDTAIEAYHQALKHQPENALVLNDLAWLLYERDASKEAVEMAEKAHELKPGAGAIQDTYGWILVQEGQVNKGLSLLQKAHQAVPEHPEITYHYAYALAQAGKHADAKLILRELLNNPVQFNGREKAQRLYEELTR